MLEATDLLQDLVLGQESRELRCWAPHTRSKDSLLAGGADWHLWVAINPPLEAELDEELQLVCLQEVVADAAGPAKGNGL